MSGDQAAETYLDEYDVVSVEQHKYMYSSHSGKGRSKREATCNTNRHDPSGHTRKAVQKLVNNNNNNNNNNNSNHHHHSNNSHDKKRAAAANQST